MSDKRLDADSRLADAFVVAQDRFKVDVPMTVAEAMKYARLAYMRGYWDALKSEQVEA